MNKAKYFLITDEEVIATVFESDKYGRTIVFCDKINTNKKIKLYDNELRKVINEIDLLEFLSSMIPIK